MTTITGYDARRMLMRDDDDEGDDDHDANGRPASRWSFNLSHPANW